MTKTKERTRNIVGYDESDIEFYARAIVNYPDHQPVRKPETSGAGVVVTTFPDGSGKSQHPALSPKELSAVIEQGSKRPRPLTHDELEQSRKNRRDARGDLQAMESWHKSEVRESTKGKRLARARGGPEDQTLKGIELGDDYWAAKSW